MLALAVWTLLLVALLYGVICLIYWWVQERFIFVGFRLSRDHAFSFRQPFTEVYLSPEPGAELHALHFTTRDPRGTVLYFHGNTGNLRRWGKRAVRFTRLGYDVLIPDYRGYGKSRGPRSEEILHEDAGGWYGWLKERMPEERIVLYGRSLGSGVAVPLAAANAPRVLILESPFADLYDAARHQFNALPYRWLLRYGFRNDRAIKRVTCPVYIFHGRRDPIVPFQSALKLYAAIPPDVPREMISFRRGYHSDLPKFPRYQRKLALILEGLAADRGR